MKLTQNLTSFTLSLVHFVTSTFFCPISFLTLLFTRTFKKLVESKIIRIIRKPKAESRKPKAESREPRAVVIWDLFDFSRDLVMLSVRCRSILALRGPRREPACIDGWDGMDGWDGRSLNFFFGPYLENYLILFPNSFRSP